MSDFNLPPGCTTSMIPGNRPEDAVAEKAGAAFDDKWIEALAAARKEWDRIQENAREEWREQITTIFENAVGLDPFVQWPRLHVPPIENPEQMIQTIYTYKLYNEALDSYVSEAIEEANEPPDREHGE